MSELQEHRSREPSYLDARVAMAVAIEGPQSTIVPSASRFYLCYASARGAAMRYAGACLRLLQLQSVGGIGTTISIAVGEERATMVSWRAHELGAAGPALGAVPCPMIFTTTRGLIGRTLLVRATMPRRGGRSSRTIGPTECPSPMSRSTCSRLTSATCSMSCSGRSPNAGRKRT